MCQDIQKVTFFCGHQVSFWWGKSRFCLFYGHGPSRFHTTYVSFVQSSDYCPRCKIGQLIKEEGKSMKSFEFRKEVESLYDVTVDSRQEQEARKWDSLAQKARSELTAAKIADLQLQIMERIIFYLSKGNITPGAKIALFRTITNLPDVFNRQELDTFFASRYFGDKERKLEESERKKLFTIAYRARLDRTFKAGLSLHEPVPMPARETIPGGAGSGSSKAVTQEKIEDGLAQMSLSP
ncbi:hypothetical protein NUW58_g1154 [Xylaria curta]|uniref:Uncharacterized protein n=1 Tax=Xylaria curta TaxID=42375 RepID=A0ACC1PP84_9PEZI|nr:hypothetical protein NUW58_g1154 [Xylaria curta]